MSSSSTLTVYSPYHGDTIDTIPLMDSSQVEDAISSADALFQDRSRWLPKYQRIEILEKTQSIMRESYDELIKIAIEEGGKPYMDTKAEVERAINGIQLAIEQIGQIKGEEIPMGLNRASTNRLAFSMREPIGIVYSISAFNHPLNLIIHQTIPAIAVGAPVLIKPASTTPLSCLNFVKILREAGLPKEWCQPIVCDRQIAEKIVSDPRVNFLSFIGSHTLGWSLRSKLAPGTRCALEHGGAAPVIVEPDASIFNALPLLAKGGFYHAGQVCVSVQRVFVHEDIVDSFTQQLTAIAENMVVGDPMDQQTEVGPLIHPDEVDRVDQWVKETEGLGGTVICGGKKLPNNCYAPTVILNPPKEAKVSSEEIFGPVICIYPYNNRERAFEMANSLPFAFQAAVFTQNLDIALECVNRLNATAVMINDHSAFRVDWMPFGGRLASGLGMGGIPYSMTEMTQEKLMVIKSPLL
jgi:acyl-CoA reductase-like NAD-dependent aldehyde dehydrogenase